jgi:anti-sigma regulatory factor (Ser/Thr protein kinase)
MPLHGLAPQSRHLIDESTRIGEARRQAQRLAQMQGLGEAAAARVAIAATELASNLLHHGGGGELLLQPVESKGGRQIELLAIDRGPGMDVQRCLRDGFSTAGTPGTGLGAVQRLAAEFDIYSVAGEGTVIMARIGEDTVKGGDDVARFGAINVAVTGETECGDCWRLATGEEFTSVLVVDGLGHGAFAAQAAQCSAEAFARAPFDPPSSVIARLHQAAVGTRGAAAACARLSRRSTLSYAGIGNIHGALVTANGSRGLVSHNGTLGLRAPRTQQFEYERAPAALLIMHSDGLSARWDLTSRAGLLQRHPAIIAGVMYREYARKHDDATVVVIG